ncbi:hypothetical protein B1218_32170, partial [Pseudomonas ogarae]
MACGVTQRQGDLGGVRAFLRVEQGCVGAGGQAVGLLERIFDVDPGSEAELAQVAHQPGELEVLGGQVINDVGLAQAA